MAYATPTIEPGYKPISRFGKSEAVFAKQADLEKQNRDIREHGQALKNQGKLLNWTFGFIVAILFICFIGFITFLLDAWRFHVVAYKEFTNTVLSQQSVINDNLKQRDELTKDIKQIKIDISNLKQVKK